jgi:nitrite reductase/ring-hydroxylating ferredoxin subunit
VEIRAASRGDISPLEARAFTVAGREIVLCEVDGEVCAVDGICTHEALSLDGGEVDEGILECPWHGARYDVRTGAVRGLPATRPLRTYAVRVDDDGSVFISVPD